MKEFAERIALRRVRGRVLVMHDFFIDRLIRLGSFDRFVDLVLEKAKAGGGSIHGIPQSEMKGGNAVNLAFALGRLGLRVTLITIADSLSKPILEASFRALRGVELALLEGRPGYTTAFEFPYEGSITNAMVSDLGETATFGPERLGEGLWSRLKGHDFVAVVNWAANMRGTDLAEEAFRRGKEAGVRTFFDPADWSARRKEVGEFIDRVVERGLTDVLSMNPLEASTMAKSLGAEPLPRRYDVKAIEGLAEALSSTLPCTVDIHSPIGSSSATQGEGVSCPAFGVEPRTLTGAGDVWDAGDLFGYLAGLEPLQRLYLANGLASLYVGSEDAQAPSLRDVGAFFQRMGG